MSASSITLEYVEVPREISSILTRERQATTTSHPKITFTNEKIIEGLKSRDTAVINHIYKQSYAQVRFFVTSNNGSVMDAEDVFQDAIVLIYQNIAKEGFYLTCSFSTYLYAICRHLWLQRLSKHKTNYEIIDSTVGHDPWEEADKFREMLTESEKYKLFQKHFNLLKKDEQKVLSLYMSKIPAKEIAKIMGFKSDKYAKFRKYLCKEKLKNMIVNDEQFPAVYNSILQCQ
jgi:RNA polymerase sigma factor (sigma-70 family)